MNNYLSSVAILLVVTNEAEHLTVFCTSLREQNHNNIKLFVLDNNCTDNSIEIIKSFFPDAFFKEFKGNAGFARGNNLLAQEAIKSGYELLFILNPDIEMHANCIRGLVKLINSDEKVGAVAPIMFFGRLIKDLNKIQSYAITTDFKKRNIVSLQSNQLFVEDKFPKEIEVNIIAGGITFIRASLVNQIGLFDERYFIYGEESDLAYRTYLAGYKMMVTSDSKVWHHHDWHPKSFSGYKFMYYYMIRNRILYFKKFKFYPQLIKDLFLQVVTSPIQLKMFYKIGSISILKYYYLGLWRGLIGETGKTRTEFK